MRKDKQKQVEDICYVKFQSDISKLAKINNRLAALDTEKRRLEQMFMVTDDFENRYAHEKQITKSQTWLQGRFIDLNMEVFRQKALEENARRQAQKSFGKFQAAVAICEKTKRRQS